MKQKYTLLKKRPVLDDAIVQKYQNFDALLKKVQQERTPIRLWKPWMAIAAAASCIGFAFLISIVMQKDSNPQPFALTEFIKTQKAYKSSTALINPPLKNLEKPFKELRVSTKEAQVLSLSEQTKVSIPANAFVDENGAFLKGEVQFRFREMFDVVDFFLTGVPLTYDTLGIEKLIASAGMVELTAWQGDKEVGLAPNKRLQVQMLSPLPLPKDKGLPAYKVYFLNEQIANWQYKNPSQVAWSSESQNGNTQKDIEAWFSIAKKNILERAGKPLPPALPAKASSSESIFELAFNGQSGAKDDQLLQSLQKEYGGKILWILPSKSNITLADLKKAWDDVLIEAKSAGNYELTFVNDNEKVSIVCQPLLKGKAYQNAMDNYQTAFKSYKEALAAYEAETALQLAQLQEDKQVKYQQKGPQVDSGVATVVHTFEVDALGIWNCDLPTDRSPTWYAATMMDENKAPIPNGTAFFTQKNQSNQLQKFYHQNIAFVNGAPASDFIMWMVTDQQQLLMAKPDPVMPFQNTTNDPIAITFVNIEQEITTEAQLRQLLHKNSY